MAEPRRQRDPRSDLSAFRLDVLVVCPQCESCASVQPFPRVDADSATWTERTFAPRRLVCGACGYTRDWPRPGEPRSATTYDDGRDPWFGLPLWLRAPCCGEVLWAYNGEHLDLIESWIAADHRERAWSARAEPTTMLERLPSWMTAAKHRDEVLKAAERLRRTLPGG